MTSSSGEGRQSLLTIRPALSTAVLVALLVWMAVVAARGAVLALQTFGISVGGVAQPNYATPPMVQAAALVYIVCLAAALATRWFRPEATLPVTYAAGGFVVLVAAINTGSVGSLAVVLAMFALAWLLGHVLLLRLPLTANVPVVRMPIATGLGIGLLGLLLMLLTTFALFTAVTVVATAAAILFLLVTIDHERLAHSLKGLRSWRRITPTWFETVVIGMAVGLVSFAMLAAFVPENQSDAIRQHLPIAREIWQTGTAGEFAPMGTSRSPIQGHLLFATAYGFGGMPAAKLVHTVVGLVGVIGVAGIGWLIAGRVAAAAGAIIFATMPVVLWELGHAYLDLFPVFFSVAAILCVMLWQRDGAWVWLICAGALAGVGFAVKLAAIWMVVALAAGVFLVGRMPFRLGNRVLASLLFGFGAVVVVVPWLVRGYGITGTLPGLNLVIEQVSSIVQGLGSPDPGMIGPGSAPAPAGAGTADPAATQLEDLGLGRAPLAPGRSPLDLLGIPWHMTFRGEVYHSQGAGDVGIALLMLLPLALLGPRTRAMAFLAVTAAASFVGWWLSPQITRHLLPTLAIAAALAGAGLASIESLTTSRARRALEVAAPIGVVIGLLAAPLLFLPNWKTGLPVDLILGRETAAEYVAREVPSASALMAANATLPADALVGYIGVWEGPQIYTESRLTYLVGGQFGTHAETVLANLDQLGIDYLVWNRAESRAADWRSTLLSTDFLRDHTRFIAGDAGTYVFEMLPDAGKTWGLDAVQNILADSGFETVEDGGPWVIDGRIDVGRSGVSLRPRSSVAQQVPVSGGTAYVLTASGRCADATDRVDLALQWFDDHGSALGSASETVIPGTEPGEQFLWRRSPDHATSVSVQLATSGGSRCEFDEITLSSLS